MSPKPVPFAPKGMKGAIPDRHLVGTAGDEIAATGFASSTAAASGRDEFEISRQIGLGAAHMSRIDMTTNSLRRSPAHFELASVID
ncbi:hypothetical protein X737_38660 [Mesorhizobium sp. L48C026A00]|nr:hypothetical protein X737_38660 [Mesorhizobium sp. L48C026A00]